MGRLLLYDGRVFVERVPNYWVFVAPAEAFFTAPMDERISLVRIAMRAGPDGPHPRSVYEEMA